MPTELCVKTSVGGVVRSEAHGLCGLFAGLFKQALALQQDGQLVPPLGVVGLKADRVDEVADRLRDIVFERVDRCV